MGAEHLHDLLVAASVHHVEAGVKNGETCKFVRLSRNLYNHIFRRKEVTAYDKRRIEMRKHVRAAFDESHQRFGANKIAAVLSEQGIRVSPKYAAACLNVEVIR